MKELYAFDISRSTCLLDLEGDREAAGVLPDLAEGFAERFQAKKRDKNLVDFK